MIYTVHTCLYQLLKGKKAKLKQCPFENILNLFHKGAFVFYVIKSFYILWNCNTFS